jgi:hypothetical protein
VSTITGIFLFGLSLSNSGECWALAQTSTGLKLYGSPHSSSMMKIFCTFGLVNP